jgi:hypothetical protein
MARTFVVTCAVAALGVALSASAQQPPQPQPSQPTPAAQAPAPAQADRATKLSGCVKAGLTPSTFELATSKKDKMAPAASQPGTPAPAQDAMAKAGSGNVKLSAGAGVDLMAHVNHQVELTGSWEQAAAAAAGADAAKAGKTFTVTSVKMVAATCTTGTN